ncbi:hypothetical protein FMO003_12620 [Moritella sp. F3]|nr:hypothetical protein FMO001_15220 [Moritella sp. F1]GIC80981.1 hypothetical protein FMO003_12620 [Moritella sp. F3]
MLTMQLETIEEHPLTTQVRALNGLLLQQPFFVQEAFKHNERLYIRYPDSVASLPITHQELQRASAETLAKPGWFDIQVLTEQSQESIVKTVVLSYSLAIRISAVDDTINDTANNPLKTHTLTLELINNRFNTVEAQVSREISL